jgi:hypothetical protein
MLLVAVWHGEGTGSSGYRAWRQGFLLLLLMAMLSEQCYMLLVLQRD